MENNTQQTGFKQLLNSMMTRRWLITLIVLITFMAVALGIMIYGWYQAIIDTKDIKKREIKDTNAK